MYDVVVIGAGPAGSTAAKVLAEQGYKGLLAERCKLPRILLRDIDSKIDGFGKAFFGEEIPDSVTCLPAENRGMIFTDETVGNTVLRRRGGMFGAAPLTLGFHKRLRRAVRKLREEMAVVACEEQDGHVSLTMKGDRTYMQTSCYVIVCEDAVGTLKKKRTGKGTPYSMIY